MDPATMAILLAVILIICLGFGVWIGAALLIAGAFCDGVLHLRPRWPGYGHNCVDSYLALGISVIAAIYLDGGNSVPHTAVRKPVQRFIPLASAHARRTIACECCWLHGVFRDFGISAATLLTVGKITIPELKRRGYPDSMVAGTLAGAGTLGLLIPPSITMIIYGIMVEESIARLFMAGLIPGLMLAGLFILYNIGWGLLTEQGRNTREDRASASKKLKGITGIISNRGFDIWRHRVNLHRYCRTN